jgi:DNA-binding IclR family transcriptional regulator
MSSHDAWFVARTMQALEVLAFSPLSAPQVAAALQVHPRTARRMLNRLVHEGYLVRGDAPERLYEPTMRIVALAGQVVARSPLARVATPFASALHELTGAAAHVLVPSYRSALCLVHCGCAGPPARPQLRELVPAHCTAGGKVLLTWRDPWRASVLAAPLERHTERTVTSTDAVLEELETVRARGHAIEDGEYQDGVRGIAAPVFSPAGEAIAALGISGRELGIDVAAGQVVAQAAELTSALESHDG